MSKRTDSKSLRLPPPEIQTYQKPSRSNFKVQSDSMKQIINDRCAWFVLLKKKKKTHKKSKQNAFFNQNKTKPIFEGILFFKATNSTKTSKSLSCCQFGAFQRDVCTRLTSCLRQVITSQPDQVVSLMHTSSLKAPCWQQLSNLFVFILFVALKKRIPWKMCIMSWFVWLKSVLLPFCVYLIVFSEHRQPTLFQIFFFRAVKHGEVRK